MPRVSVVIPAYNNARYIGAAMQSVLEQDYRDLELVVADHSSTDGTLRAIEQFHDPRITVLSTPTGGGAPANWERVTAAASGEYVRLVCGDDVLLPGTVGRHVAALDANPGAHLAASPRRIIDVRGDTIIESRGLHGITPIMSGADVVRRTVRAGTNVFGEPACVTMRLATLREVGGWDPRFPYLIDEATYVRVLLEGDFVPVAGQGAAFRMSASQWSVALAGDQAAQAAAFHAWLHAARPDVVGRRDVIRGDLRALGFALARRAVYIAYARRMAEV